MTALNSVPDLSAPADRPGSARLVADAVSLGYGERTVVDKLSVTIPDAAVTVIVGANACGKSTLLRGMARLLRPASGAVLLDGQAIHRLSTKQVARTLGLLPQSPVTPEGSRSSTWSAGAGTRTRVPSAGGAPGTRRRSRRRWR